MPITHEYNEQDKKYEYFYKPRIDREVFEDYKILTAMFREFLRLNNIGYASVNINIALIVEAFRRVDMRKEYFSTFLKIKLCETRESALLAYWIIKLKPFAIKSTSMTVPKNIDFSRKINEEFAATLILSAARATAQDQEANNFKISEKYRNKLVYSLQYWDVSENIIMSIAEALLSTTEQKDIDTN